MILVRELAETGRRIRVDADRRQRLPCAEGWIVSGPDLSDFHEILAEELNVEMISLEEDLDRFQRSEVVPNRRSLGAKCRQDLPAVLQGIADGDSEAMQASIQAGNLIIAGYEIGEGDIELRRVEREGYAAQTVQISDSSVSLVLDMSNSPELLSKGLARDITRRIQASRKDMDLAIEDTISLEIWMKDAPELFSYDKEWILNETRASSANFNSGEGDGESFEVDGSTIWYSVKRS
jgi:isoleucyl-tRNA synthetase